MTNGIEVRVVPVSNGFEGHIRKVHKASWEPVCVNGVAQLYATETEAEVAAWRALHAHLQSDIVGTGVRVSAQRSKAEELFGGIFRKGRKIVVERRDAGPAGRRDGKAVTK